MSALIDRVKNPPKPPLPILICCKLGGLILPVAQIAIGVVHLDNCPQERHIPVYLVVMGVFGIMLALLSCLPCAQNKEGSSDFCPRICTIWNSLASAFVFCWFIAGNVWVYRIYEPNYVQNATAVVDYCNKTVYLFAFWTITAVYILVGVALLGGCCVLVCFFLCGRADPDD